MPDTLWRGRFAGAFRHSPLGVMPVEMTVNTYRSILMPLHVDDNGSEAKRAAEVVAKSKQSDDDEMPI
jgi:hypothetical protein